MKGIVIAGTKSGSGKTSITLGLIQALVKRGVSVVPFKVGPDFIDPGHHALLAGIPSRNLDGWMLSRDYNLDCFHGAVRHADIAVVEGVMGLFDGYEGHSEAGSTAQMAKWLNLPVLLVVDAKSMARSAAALVQGFQNFDPELNFAGVIFNNIGSTRHLAYLMEALKDNVSLPCLGGLPRDSDIAIPERHLGLVTMDDHPLTGGQADQLAAWVENNIHIDGLLDRLEEIPAGARVKETAAGNRARDKVNIGVARDNAFCFYYQDNLDILTSLGADLHFFSPIRDEDLPQGLDGLYFGGGYPELYAGQLERNQRIRNRINRLCRDGMPIYGECGGFMYLCQGIQNLDNKRFSMCGCFPFSTQMLPGLRSLGYRHVALKQDTILGPAGLEIRGHEFHYSKMVNPDPEIQTVYALADRRFNPDKHEGYIKNRTLGSYVHLHFGSNPEAATSFLDHCRRFRKERNDRNETP